MPMNATTLGNSIKANLISAGYAVDDPALAAIWQNIAQSVITHITTSAVVTVPAGIAVQVNTGTGTGATTAPAAGTIS